MKTHIIYYYILMLVASLLVSCREDRQIALRAEEALHEVGERYHAEKSICDSLLDVATSYYLPDLAKGDTTLSSLTSSPQQAECMLYEGIRHHDRAQELKSDMEAYAVELNKAYRLFLEVEQNMDLLSKPYLKVVVNDRLALVSISNDNHNQALSYFRKELHFAHNMCDTTAIALSYMHLSYSYYKLNICDSALFYSNQALYLAPHLDGRILAALYANTMHLRHFYRIEKERNDSLLSIIPFEACLKNDSCRIFTILADYYFEKGCYKKADSLLRWTISHSDGKPELLSMAYQRRSKLFEQKGMLDSALVLLKSYSEQHTLASQSKLGTEIAETRSRYEQLQQQRHHEHVVAVFIVIFLIIILLFLMLWIRRTKQKRQLELQIANINAKMDQFLEDYASLQSTMNHQLTESQEREEKLKRKFKKLPSKEKSLHAQIEYLLRRFIMFDKNAPWPSSLSDELFDIYRKFSKERCHLIDELDKLNMPSHHKVICLLISEHKHNTKNLWFYAGCASDATFRSTKSQIKRKLEAASSSPEIQSLLKNFSLDRGPEPRSAPNVNNEGSK